MGKPDLKTRLSEKIQKSQPPSKANKPTGRKIINMQETALAVVEPGYISLPDNALDIINVNLKNRPLSRQSIDTVKAPGGGVVAFTVPGLSGDEIHKELAGVILDYSTPRAYWETSDPIEGTPPTCYSLDSMISHEGQPCSQCLYNEFGSKEGDSNAKACKEAVELYLLRPDNIMPIVVRVPVSSKGIFQKYMTRLVSNMIPINGVVTKITLEKATSRSGQAYAQFNFEAVNMLDSEEASNLKAFSLKIMEVLTTNEVLPVPHEANGEQQLDEAV